MPRELSACPSQARGRAGSHVKVGRKGVLLARFARWWRFIFPLPGLSWGRISPEEQRMAKGCGQALTLMPRLFSPSSACSGPCLATRRGRSYGSWVADHLFPGK